MKLVAIHEIEYRGAKGSRQFARPGHMFEVDGETGLTLKRMGAARDPNEAELALEALKSGKRKSTKVAAENESEPRGSRRKDDGGDSEKEQDDVV